jgi:hypothetical protein
VRKVHPLCKFQFGLIEVQNYIVTEQSQLINENIVHAKQVGVRYSTNKYVPKFVKKGVRLQCFQCDEIRIKNKYENEMIVRSVGGGGICGESKTRGCSRMTIKVRNTVISVINRMSQDYDGATYLQMWKCKTSDKCTHVMQLYIIHG